MKAKVFVSTLVIAIGLSGCSAHSPFIAKDTDEVHLQQGAKKYPSHSNQVYVTSGPLPDTAQYETLATLEVGKVWYGSSENVLQSLADGARELGADAVIEVDTWHQPSGWSWAAPHGSGKAVKISEAASVDFSGLDGAWK